MIRRHVDADFFLITQHEHALLSGKLAEHFGNDRFARPDPYGSTILATQMHDSGWPLHDDRPTLNGDGLPLDVFETPRSIALEVWRESANRAADADAYAGLLTSLHVLSLSALNGPPAGVTPNQLKERFELNKFQHQEIERQEKLRRKLGLRTDLPLRLGLAEGGADPVEDRLLFNFRILQAMDQLSLALCCTEPPSHECALSMDATSPPLRMKLRRDGAQAVTADPWPFDAAELAFEIPCRRVRGGSFQDVDEFRQTYLSAAVESMSVRVRR